MTAEFRVLNVESTISKMRLLNRRVRTRVLRKSIRAGGSVVLKAAKAKAPKVNRGLSKSLIQKVKTFRDGNVISIVGQDLSKVRRGGSNQKKRLRGGGISGRGDTVPIHLVERPTRSHIVPRRRGKVLAFEKAGKRRRKGSLIFTMRIRHPGTTGKRFIERVQRETASSVRKAIARKAAAEIDAEARKIATDKLAGIGDG